MTTHLCSLFIRRPLAKERSLAPRCFCEFTLFEQTNFDGPIRRHCFYVSCVNPAIALSFEMCKLDQFSRSRAAGGWMTAR